MKVQGFFEKIWEQKKEGSNWVNTYGEFCVKGESDVIRVNIPHTEDWRIEHGLTENVVGEANISFRKEKSKDGTKEYYTQKVWEWKTMEQLAREEAERDAKKAQKIVHQEKNEVQKAAADRMMADAAADANEPEVTTNLPF